MAMGMRVAIEMVTDSPNINKVGSRGISPNLQKVMHATNKIAACALFYWIPGINHTVTSTLIYKPNSSTIKGANSRPA